MSVLSAPLKNDIAMQKDIFRLAAAIYSETNDVVSDAEIQLQIIKCMFVATGNDYLTKSEIISKLLEIYKYHISEDEVDNTLRKTKGVFQTITKDDENAVCLTQSAFSECEEAQKNNIDSFIDAFITEREIADPEKCKNAIHIYLYELTTTNINSYRVLLAGKDGTQFTSSELSVDVSSLSDEEKQLVYDFLAWDNIAKNAALGNLVYCCLEYCLLINGDSPNNLLKGFIRRREIYLDTNVIFRALGINGVSRQNVVTTFLHKCKQAKLKLLISHATRTEFFDTIGYYVSQMEHYPRGNIYSGAYEQIADYSIFAFYENWRQEHVQMSLKYFITHIKSLYLKMVKDFGIEDDVKIPGTIYHSGEFKDARNRYSASIKNVKQGIKADYLADDYHYSNRDSHDATVVRYIELLREKSEDKDIFLASSDKALRLWDMNRLDGEYPVVVYPSQLFLVLLKTCGRSANDYDSFVSFINIRPSSKRVSPENAHIILSGISSITEDINAQKYLVEAVFSDDFQNVIQNTGFDAPSCTYLYIDKAMHDHGLFQAICRVNRLDGESKDFGYIVDYKELFGDLADAMNKYTAGAFESYDAEDIDGLLKDRATEAKKYFIDTLEELDELCEGVELPRDELNYIHYFCGESGHDEDQDEAFARIREKLYKLVGRLVRAYAELKPRMMDLGYTVSEQSALDNKVAFYVNLRDTIGRASGDFIDLKAYEPGMRYLIDNYICASESQKIGSMDDFTLLDFIITQEDKLKSEHKGEQESAAETIENNIRKKVVERMVINPAYYAKMSAILEQLILDRRRGVLAYGQLLDTYMELAKNVAKPEENTKYPESIRSNGALRALYDNCGEDEETALKLHKAIVKARLEGFRNNPVKANKIKRALYQLLNDDNEVERIYQIVVEQEEY